MNKNRSLWLWLGMFAVGILLLSTGLWANQGYGEVSSEAYQYSTALYSACLSKNRQHLNKIETMLSSSENVSQNERRWLEEIIALAQSDDWTSASKDARRMMEDQVDY